jgi:hypothetical protein
MVGEEVDITVVEDGEEEDTVEVGEVVDMGDVEEVHENNDTCMHVCMIPCSK